MLGTAVHAALAAHYTRMLGTPVAPPLDAARAVLLKHVAPASHHERAEAIVTAYLDKYQNDPFTPVSAEREYGVWFAAAEGGGDGLGVPTLGPVPYTARLDLVLRAPSGKLWIVDYKTGARPTGASRLAYTLSMQFVGQVLIGQRTWGKDFGGLMIVEAKSRPPYKVVRVPISVPAPALRDFPRMIRDTAAEIAAYYAKCGTNPNLYPRVQDTTICRVLWSQETVDAGGRVAGWCDHVVRCYGVMP